MKNLKITLLPTVLSLALLMWALQGCIVVAPPGGPAPGAGGPPPPGSIHHEHNTDRLGMNYKNFDLQAPDPGLCEAACLKDPGCRAFTFVHPGVQGPKARCWLKHGVPAPKGDGCCISGVK
jgi:hypothetical protein